jgi:ferritin-like metal-binding protein YciE/uncharacterized protein (DUF433 family)
MTSSTKKLVRYLHEAHAMELALISVLRADALVAPRGSYRTAVESHLRETHRHASRVERRLHELDGGDGPVEWIFGAVSTVVGQALALGKAPFGLIRGSSGEEVVLKNAKDEYAAESLEIATYLAIERAAQEVDDEQTARLAADIRAQEERMRARLEREIPSLAAAVMGEVAGNGSYELGQTGGADAIRDARSSVSDSARQLESAARQTARKARKVPGVARTEGRVKGAVAAAENLAIPHYDEATAQEIVERLPHLSQVEIAKIEAYERRTRARSTILSRISTLQADEPWPGYDELNVDEIRKALVAADRTRMREVASYERSHKGRVGVIEAATRENETVAS